MTLLESSMPLRTSIITNMMLQVLLMIMSLSLYFHHRQLAVYQTLNFTLLESLLLVEVTTTPLMLESKTLRQIYRTHTRVVQMLSSLVQVYHRIR